jgi:hypothetical protein
METGGHSQRTEGPASDGFDGSSSSTRSIIRENSRRLMPREFVGSLAARSVSASTEHQALSAAISRSLMLRLE